jgi:hypothetical protein
MPLHPYVPTIFSVLVAFEPFFMKPSLARKAEVQLAPARHYFVG